jgi:hypothetical protein
MDGKAMQVIGGMLSPCKTCHILAAREWLAQPEPAREGGEQ